MGGLLSQLAAVGAFDAQGEPEPGGDTVYLWPECVDAWGHWQQLQTQWRAGFGGGATGLDYSGVRAYLDEQGIEPGPERRELFACLQACEVACLEAWSELRSKDPPPPTNR